MKPSKSRLIADLSGVVRPDATSGTSSGGGTRTPDTRIMIPHAPPLNLEENDDFGEGAAHSTALETAKAPIDPDLATVTDAGHPHGDPGHRRGRSGAVTAKSEPRPPASLTGAVSVIACSRKRRIPAIREAILAMLRADQ